MAKSNIIKELATDACDIDTALNRLYLIATSINDIELSTWAKKELSGYTETDEVPNYRVVSTHLVGNFNVVGAGKIWTYTKAELPCVNSEILDKFKKRNLYLSVKALSMAIKNDKAILIPLDMRLIPFLEEGTTISISAAYQEITNPTLQDTVQTIKNRLLDSLIYLENQFGCLDELDIDISQYKTDLIQKVYDDCAKIVLQGISVTNIVDSKISKSNLGRGNRQEKTTTVEIDPQITIEKKESDGWFSKIKKIFSRKK